MVHRPRYAVRSRAVSRTSGPRRLRTPILSIVTVVALVVGGVAIYRGTRHRSANACVVDTRDKPDVPYKLDADQASNATTIAAVGKRLGLPDHAVTVGLAAALQESHLHNLSHGDRDSLGLFQQRPSQGWGTAAQVTDPAYAANAFFTHLARVPNWQALAVTTAVQEVQRSSAPEAYAQWEPEARALARAMTGEVAAALTCRSSTPDASSISPDLQATMTNELGPVSLGTTVSALRGWTIATWLVAHAPRFGITAVEFNGHRWTPSSGVWKTHSPAVARIDIVRTAAT
jgi:hypothetical protein